MDFKGLIKPEDINWIKGLPIAVEVYSVSNMPPRIHNDVLEIIICLEGACDFSFAFEQHKFEKGDFLAIDEDAFSLTNGEDCICASIYIDLEKFVSVYPLINYTFFACEGTERHMHLGKYNALKGMILSLLHYLSENEEWDEGVLKRYADILLEKMIMDFNVSSYISGIDLDRESLYRLIVVNRYIMNCLESGSRIQISEAADELGITPGYLSEFVRRYGMNFRELVSYFKSVKAELYLMSGEYTMLDISEICGFSDTKYFYKDFRKWHNMSPREFRDKYRELSLMTESVKQQNIQDEKIASIIDREIRRHYLMFFSPHQ